MLKAITVLAVATLAGTSMAALSGSDNASNYTGFGGTPTPTNGGSGFTPWQIFNQQTAGTFLAGAGSHGFSSSQSSIGSGSPLQSWGSFSNSSADPITVGVRGFTTDGQNIALGNGQSFSIQMDNGFVSTGRFVGVALSNSITSGNFADLRDGYLNSNTLSFGFVGGFSNYRLFDSLSGAAGFDTGVPYTNTTGLTVQYNIIDWQNYQLLITPVGGTTTTINRSVSGLGSLINAPLLQWSIINAQGTSGTGGGDWNAYFNNARVVPTPGAAALLGLGGIVAAGRRRK